MGWKFWQSDERKNKPARAEKTESAPSKSTKLPPLTEDNISHAGLNGRTQAIIDDVESSIPSQIEDIQNKAGDIKAINKWLDTSQGSVDIILKYAKENRAPTKKEIIYGDVFSKGAIPDSTEAVEYNERLQEYLKEHRPEDGFFKNWGKASVEAKRQFVEKFELFAEALKKDVATEVSQQEEALYEAKEKAFSKITALYGFYEQLQQAVDAGDLDAMLDISHNRTEAIVKRVLKKDLSQMLERDELTALVTHIGVYDKIIDLAATASSKEEGLTILQKVLADTSDPFKVLSFMEDIFVAMGEDAQGPAYETYNQFLIDYVGDYIRISDLKSYNIENLFGISLNADGTKLTFYTQTGLNNLAEEEFTFKDGRVGNAYMRVLTQREDFAAMAHDKSLFNLRYTALLKAGNYNPATHEEYAVPAGIKTTKPDDTAADGDMKYGVKLMARIDKRGWTELTTPHITNEEEFSKLKTKVEKFTNLKSYGAIPLMDINDVAAASYDKEANCVVWAVPCASYGLEWYRHETSPEDAAIFLEALKQEDSFFDMQNGWIYNLSKIQRVEYGDIPEEYSAIQLPSIDYAKDTYLNDGQEIIMEEVPLESIMKELDLDNIFTTEISLDEISDQELDLSLVDKDTIAAQIARENKTESAEDLSLEAPAKVLRFSFESGEDGHTDLYEIGIDDEQARQILDAIAAKNAMTAITDDFIVNTHQLNIAKAYVINKEEQTAYNFDANASTDNKPVVVLSFNDNIGESTEIALPVTPERMRTVIDDLTSASAAFVHKNKLENYNGFAAFKTNLVAIKPTQDKNGNTKTIEYCFTNSYSEKETSWSLQYEDGYVETNEEQKTMRAPETVTLMGKGDTPKALSVLKKNIISVSAQSGDLSDIFMTVATNTGLQGRVTHEFGKVTAQNANAILSNLRVCGHNKTAINDNPPVKTVQKPKKSGRGAASPVTRS